MSGLIDTHCHLQFSEFDSDRAEMMMRAHQVGVTHFVVPGVTATTWATQRDYARRYQHWFNAFGLHPYFIDEHVVGAPEQAASSAPESAPSQASNQTPSSTSNQTPDHITLLERELQRGGAVAVGEIGLDATCANMHKQQQLFKAQLELAVKFQLPVILHHRKTLDTMLKMVRDAGVQRGVVHAFSGSEQQAQAWVDAGFKLGVGGVITYPRAQKTRRAIAAMPLEALVLETDSPDMPTCGKQGERNEPAYMTRVFDALCELRSEPAYQLREALHATSAQLFKL